MVRAISISVIQSEHAIWQWGWFWTNGEMKFKNFAFIPELCVSINSRSGGAMRREFEFTLTPFWITCVEMGKVTAPVDAILMTPTISTTVLSTLILISMLHWVDVQVRVEELTTIKMKIRQDSTLVYMLERLLRVDIFHLQSCRFAIVNLWV